MKTTNINEAQGSITKNVSLTPIDYKIIENTFVAEAGNLYTDYYGEVPQKKTPNSLFLFTKQFYPLDDLLKITCEMKEFFGYTKKIDVATSILDFTDHYHYAIRVRDFPDYQHIHWLQTCYKSEGVNFSRKVHLLESARITVFKCFSLEKLDEGIYLDKKNDHRGYITIPCQINNDEFAEMLIFLRNNNDCELFDATTGTLEINSSTINVVRLYAENMNIALLRCAKDKFSKYILRKELQAY